MTEEVNTQNGATEDLSESEKLTLILAGLVRLNQRVAKREALAGDRARDTHPMLERIHKKIADVHFELSDLRCELRLAARSYPQRA